MLKFSVKRETLLKPVQIVAGLISNRPTMPILSHILLVAKGTTLTLVGTDTEVELCASINIDQEVQTQEEIKTTIPGKKFLDICRALPEGGLIELSEEVGKMIISSGKSRFVLATLPAKNFPRTPEQENGVELKITQKILRKLVEKTSFSIPQEDVRQYLNGLLLEVKKGVIRSLATDGHRLAVCDFSMPAASDLFAQVIIPRKGIIELLRLLDETEKEVSVIFSNSFICVKGESFGFVSKLIGGKFPNYNKIIPQRGDKILKISSDELKQALMRVGVLSNELFRSVNLQLGSGVLMLSSNNSEQEEAKEELTVDYNEKKIDATFNVGYLLGILNVIDSEKINIYFNDGDSGAVIDEGERGDFGCLYAIMPIRKQ